MNTIYSITAAAGTAQLSMDQQWTQGSSGLAAGYTGLVPVQVGAKLVLFAFNKATQQLDAYLLTGSAPWVAQATTGTKLAGGPWDMISTFVLGNIPYLLTYRADTGGFGYFAILNDLTLSPPFIFAASHTTPSNGFSTVAPYTSLLNGQYVLGYDVTTGRVENFSVVVVPTSAGGVPPLLATNVWFHQWAKGWTHFAFFQLGGSNFFFKINRLNPQKLNVNIDHMQDNPAMGSIEVGTQLQSVLPDVLTIDIAAIIPWAYGEPYLFTYVAATGSANVYQVHADCLGWTLEVSKTLITGASLAAPYQIGNTSYVLMYDGQTAGK